MEVNTVAIVPFREGSKRLPKKNFMDFCGVSLWERAAIQGARTCDKVICSSDADTSFKSHELQGQIFDKRPKHLATDTSTMADVIGYLIRKYNLTSEVVALLQPTTPLRQDTTVKQTIKKYLESSYSLVMSLVEEDNKILKYGMLDNGTYNSINNIDYCFENQQNLPKIYAPNGAIYVFKASDFQSSNGFPTKKIGGIVMPHEESVDIDSLADLVRAREIAQSLG